MNIGALVLCRLSSRRLPGKQLKIIGGKTVLQHIIDRVRTGAPEIPIVVATSDQETDNELVKYCADIGLDYYRGPLEDVAGRFLACAEDYGWRYAVRINGDSIFLDSEALREMIDLAYSDRYHFITNKPGKTFPVGMSIEVVRVQYYRNVMKNVIDPYHREHVTTWLYKTSESKDMYIYRNDKVSEASGMHLAIDTKEDWKRTVKMFQKMERDPASYTLEEIVKFANLVGEENSTSS